MLNRTVKNTLGYIIILFFIIAGLSLFKRGESTVLTRILLGMASFSPLNPQVSIETNSLCIEKSKGIPIQIQAKNILLVFKRDGSRQCEEDQGISVKEMVKELKKMDVKVFKAVKGHIATGRGLSVCGSPTNNINIFYVSSKKKKEVFDKGFQTCMEKINQ